MNTLTKTLIIFIVGLFSITTMQNMTASNQFDSPDLDTLAKISFISETMEEKEINYASFMNEDVTLMECKEIFNTNNFNHFNYQSCSNLINDLNISALDKKSANDLKIEKNTLPSLI